MINKVPNKHSVVRFLSPPPRQREITDFKKFSPQKKWGGWKYVSMFIKVASRNCGQTSLKILVKELILRKAALSVT